MRGEGNRRFSRGPPSGGRICRKGPHVVWTGLGRWMGRGKGCVFLRQGSVWELWDMVGEDDECGSMIFRLWCDMAVAGQSGQCKEGSGRRWAVC